MRSTKKDLIEKYARILQSVDKNVFAQLQEDDKNAYSGVFLPIPFDAYYTNSPRIMVVGRETASWNTKNKKNKITRIINAIDGKGVDTLENIIGEALTRYQKHLDPHAIDVNIKKPSPGRSRFKQFYFRLAKEFHPSPKALIYANLFAWDYNGKSPRYRPKQELEEVTRLSCMLLAAQIESPQEFRR